MRQFDTHRLAPVAATLAVLLAAPLAFAGTQEAPEVRNVGQSTAVYRGPVLDVALSWRYAKANVGEPWLLLDVALTAERNTVRIDRGDIAVRGPDGTLVPLATQAQFADVYPQLVSTIARANVAAEPLGYLTPHRPRGLDLFAAPGVSISFPTVWIDTWHNSIGRLYFHVPDGTRHGRYTLLIRLPKDTVEIPFTL